MIDFIDVQGYIDEPGSENILAQVENGSVSKLQYLSE